MKLINETQISIFSNITLMERMQTISKVSYSHVLPYNMFGVKKKA